MSHFETKQMYAVSCSTGHDVAWGPMDLLYAQTFCARMNALSLAQHEQTGKKLCVYRVIVLWIEAVVANGVGVEAKKETPVRMN